MKKGEGGGGNGMVTGGELECFEWDKSIEEGRAASKSPH